MESQDLAVLEERIRDIQIWMESGNLNRSTYDWYKGYVSRLQEQVDQIKAAKLSIATLKE